MITISFIIPGNHENPHGNAIPKLRMTGNQSWKPEAQRYAAWKKYVQDCIQPHLVAMALDLREKDQRKLIKGNRYLKPISDVADKIRMDIMIHWADETHGDPESIFGSIADALFIQDKHLAGDKDFCHAPDKKGFVEVKISFSSYNSRNKGRVKSISKLK